MSYNNKILIFYNNSFLNYNIYFNNFNNIGTGLIGTHSCGDIFYFQILLSFFNIFLLDFKYKIYGCGSAISSISLSSFYLLNKFYYQFLFLKNIFISNKLILPSLKFHCSIFSEEIINYSLLNYKNNYIIFYF
ncbi:hypothetical protein NDNC_0400 [Candidatus Nasuia deltocephalinicola]|uniref:NIF system FeS cluster assembly NifU N-terminal domain-containing protein n=1 Tax=Candidatus Nasuia deltocephalincola TaxID=1160784 RepID=A0A974WLG4_9PROT|nr:hypothetical protein CU086_00700 [Candidatus Nasuia deltocephalinicola]BEH03874.1 hypothetical protein NDNC_0400 [Candidatus Nasuia deltocephalinicola]